MMLCRRFNVSGLVQGVGFRYAAYAQARSLALTGWVRNLPNGDVEVLACGAADKLDTFERWLRQGPPAARVSDVVAADAPPQALNAFDIR